MTRSLSPSGEPWGWSRGPALLRGRWSERFFGGRLAYFFGRHFLQHLACGETPEAESGVEIFGFADAIFGGDGSEIVIGDAA